MTKPLSQIISDGSLLDNTVHKANEGIFRAGHTFSEVEIYQGRGANHPWSVWPLMQKAANLDSESSDLIFRAPSAEYEHNTNDPLIRLGGGDPLNFTLTTGNLIGCVKYGDYTLRVSSRFGDEFLKYIVADADGFVELPDQGGTDRGGYEWLLVYLWLVKLKAAFRLGLPKAYETRSESLTRVRGRLDPVDYFMNEGRARYHCTYREHSYNNDITRLVARTLSHLRSHHFLRDAHAISQTFQIATEGHRGRLQELLATKTVRNPYYAAYNPVITLSKQILREELSDFGSASDTSAFLFDVSMLFEYFIRKLLGRAGMKLHDKTSQNWVIPRGQPNSNRVRSLIPDLVFEFEERSFVFDVKYKRFDFRDGVKREDIFQLHTYIGQAANEFDVAGCGFIYPILESRWNAVGLDACDGIWTSTITQGRHEIPFHVAFIKVPERGDTAINEWSEVFQTRFKEFIDLFIQNFAATLLGTDEPRSIVRTHYSNSIEQQLQ